MKAKGEGSAEDEVLDSITNSMDLNLRKLQETVKDRETRMLLSMGPRGFGQDLVTETTTTTNMIVMLRDSKKPNSRE